MMTDMITLKLSPEDKKFLKQEAKKERLSLSAYVRNTLLSGYENNTIKDFQ